MNKRYVEIEGTVTALTPIFHGGDEKTGSTPVLRTIMVFVDGLGVSILSQLRCWEQR